MRTFDGRVALVTGAATGIGRATAVAFARAGARVVCADVNDDELATTVAACGEAAGVGDTGDEAVAVAVHMDVTVEAEVAAGVALAVERFGRLDDAGIEGSLKPVDEQSEDEWSRMLAVNLTGVWRCLRAEARAMRAGGGGSIVNCASILGTVGFANAAPYTAAKHGVLGLTKTAAIDLAPAGIRVNAVCPGFIATPMLGRAGLLEDAEKRAGLEALHPIGRLGEADEIASAVLWLCDPSASFVTGHPLLVDGGYVAR